MNSHRQIRCILARLHSTVGRKCGEAIEIQKKSSQLRLNGPEEVKKFYKKIVHILFKIFSTQTGPLVFDHESELV